MTRRSGVGMPLKTPNANPNRLFAAMATAPGLPPASTALFVLANTLLVGLSEERMLGGVLLLAPRSRRALRPSILIASALFGAVHLLNVFITGQLFETAVQAVAASLSGMLPVALLVALLVRMVDERFFTYERTPRSVVAPSEERM